MSTDNEQNKVEQLAAELAKAKREIDSLKREKRRVGLSFNRIPETGYDISRLWNGDFPYLQKLSNNSLEKQPSDPTFHADANSVLIEADNLATLMAMQLTHKGKVDVIYIDPPYNTGQGFIYNDARKSSIRDVEGVSASDYESNLDGKARMIGKDDPERHSMWLSFMERRLWLAKELLSDKGVIFVSIDDNEYHRLSILVETIFSESNFIGNFIWTRTKTASNLSSSIKKNAEYVIAFAKNLNNISLSVPLTAERDTAPLLNAANKTAILTFPAKSVNIGFSGSSPKGKYGNIRLLDDIAVEDGLNKEEFRLEGKFRWLNKTLQEELSNGTKIFIKTKNFAPRYFRAFSTGRTTPSNVIPNNLVDTNEVGRKELEAAIGEGSFSYPKPTTLIKYILEMVNNNQAVVLDFFAGSGTTAHAVAELNKEDGGTRKCILVTHGDEDGKNIAEDVTAERMQRALSGKNWADSKEHEALPGSLYYYKLLFAPKTTNPLTAMETMQTRFTGLAALEQDAHVELENEPNYTVLMSGKKVVVVWKNEDALLDEPESEFYPLLNRLKEEHSTLNHIVYTPSNQSSSSDEYGVEKLGWVNYSFPMEYISSHAALLERMKRNKTMLQPYSDSGIESKNETPLNMGNIEEQEALDEKDAE